MCVLVSKLVNKHECNTGTKHHYSIRRFWRSAGKKTLQLFQPQQDCGQDTRGSQRSTPRAPNQPNRRSVQKQFIEKD